MKSELKRHLLPLTAIFIITSVYWFFSRIPWYQYLFLFSGLSIGSFLLDIDHLLYWLFLNPNIEESRLAQIAFKKHDFISLLKLLESTHHKHTSLIFHHFFFQVVLAAISIFIFTSSNNIFIKGLILALNIHLLVDEINDFRSDKNHLQDWLFAREQKQLPINFLSRYIGVFTIITIVFILLLIVSP